VWRRRSVLQKITRSTYKRGVRPDDILFTKPNIRLVRISITGVVDSLRFDSRATATVTQWRTLPLVNSVTDLRDFKPAHGRIDVRGTSVRNTTTVGVAGFMAVRSFSDGPGKRLVYRRRAAVVFMNRGAQRIV